MKRILEIILPQKIDNSLKGSKLPFFVFAIYAVISTGRSLIHLLATDGGAGSIAGMDLSVTGAQGIILAFALWGSSQLILALIQIIVVLRYRALVPLMYCLLIIEILLRQLVGYLKPVSFAHTPPGAIANQIILPLALLMLVMSVRGALRSSS